MAGQKFRTKACSKSGEIAVGKMATCTATSIVIKNYDVPYSQFGWKLPAQLPSRILGNFPPNNHSAKETH